MFFIFCTYVLDIIYIYISSYQLSCLSRCTAGCSVYRSQISHPPTGSKRIPPERPSLRFPANPTKAHVLTIVGQQNLEKISHYHRCSYVFWSGLRLDGSPNATILRWSVEAIASRLEAIASRLEAIDGLQPPAGAPDALLGRLPFARRGHGRSLPSRCCPGGFSQLERWQRSFTCCRSLGWLWVSFYFLSKVLSVDYPYMTALYQTGTLHLRPRLLDLSPLWFLLEGSLP